MNVSVGMILGGHYAEERVSGTLSPPRGLGAATWAVARPYRAPRRWPVRVQPFPLRLSPGFFSGEPTGELHGESGTGTIFPVSVAIHQGSELHAASSLASPAPGHGPGLTWSRKGYLTRFPSNLGWIYSLMCCF